MAPEALAASSGSLVACWAARSSQVASSRGNTVIEQDKQTNRHGLASPAMSASCWEAPSISSSMQDNDLHATW